MVEGLPSTDVEVKDMLLLLLHQQQERRVCPPSSVVRCGAVLCRGVVVVVQNMKRSQTDTRGRLPPTANPDRPPVFQLLYLLFLLYYTRCNGCCVYV